MAHLRAAYRRRRRGSARKASRKPLGRVEAWNDQTAREFARACAAHVREHAWGRAAEYVAGDSAARVGYIAAHAAEAMTPGGFAAERRWQFRWFADRLGVPGNSGPPS